MSMPTIIGALALLFIVVTILLDRVINPALERKNREWTASAKQRERIEYLNSVLEDYQPLEGDRIQFNGIGPDRTMTITREMTGDVWTVAL